MQISNDYVVYMHNKAYLKMREKSIDFLLANEN